MCASRAQHWVGLPHTLSLSLPSKTNRKMYPNQPYICVTPAKTYNVDSMPNVGFVVFVCRWLTIYVESRVLIQDQCFPCYNAVTWKGHISYSIRLLNKPYIVQYTSMSNCQGLLCPHPHPSLLISTKQSAYQHKTVGWQNRAQKKRQKLGQNKKGRKVDAPGETIKQGWSLPWISNSSAHPFVLEWEIEFYPQIQKQKRNNLVFILFLSSSSHCLPSLFFLFFLVDLFS